MELQRENEVIESFPYTVFETKDSENKVLSTQNSVCFSL